MTHSAHLPDGARHTGGLTTFFFIHSALRPTSPSVCLLQERQGTEREIITQLPSLWKIGLERSSGSCYFYPFHDTFFSFGLPPTLGLMTIQVLIHSRRSMFAGMLNGEQIRPTEKYAQFYFARQRSSQKFERGVFLDFSQKGFYAWLVRQFGNPY